MTHRNLRISARARRDLRAIVLFIAKRNGDFAVAERFAQHLLDRCSQLSEAPGTGSSHQGRPALRKINEGAYKIFYRVTTTRIVILRIWDGGRGHDPAI